MPVLAWATHNRAGEITYRHISGFTYEALITTYTKTSASAADRDQLEILWGDGTRDTLPRESITPLPQDVQRNQYRGTHTYAGAGTFIISMQDPNRNQGIVNIPNSVNVIFYIESVLTISNFLGNNNSAVLLNPPLDNACLNQIFLHNPAAYDPDGDSLSYRLIVCKTNGGQDIPGYIFPDDLPPGPNNNLDLDPITGDLIWDSPKFQGEYNVAFLIEEWRDGVLMGYVERDMQITAVPCSNQPPEIQPIDDTCVVVGEVLFQDVVATDPDGHPIDLTAFGEPFNISGSIASFTQDDDGPPATGTFIWSPACEHVRRNPYTITIKAKDRVPSEVDLVDFESFQVTVIAPPPENLSASPSGNSVELTWDPSICTEAAGYFIYRNLDSIGYEADFCVTGVPPGTGYVRIGSTVGHQSVTFTDDEGLALGQRYCYIVTAYFDDGAESLPSIESCASLIKDLAVITNVSVGSTSVSVGRDTIRWSNPSELKEDQYPGPYYYEVYHVEGYGTPNTLVYTSSESDFIIGYPDTTFVHTGINTQDFANTYRIDLYSGEDYVGPTFVTPSIYLTTEPRDNRLIVKWDDRTPWLAYFYEVYRFDDELSEYVLIDTAYGDQYVDTGLVNLQSYCYYAKSIGGYSSESLRDTLINFTQETCGIPWDNEAPCAPELSLVSDCEAGENLLTWTNPNSSCADDVMMYTIYYNPDSTGTTNGFEPILEISSAEDTVYLFTDLPSVAGCYAITASDSLSVDPDGNPVQNESEFSNIVCADNCPIYEMPNVFTPNNDNFNDLLVPVESRQVNQVQFKVYNRWGVLVFETNNPNLEWDGFDMNSNELVSDGVYFYTIEIESIRLQGNVVSSQAGYIYVLGGNSSNNG